MPENKNIFVTLIGPSRSRIYVSTINGVFSLLSSSPQVTFHPEGVIAGF
jgi:hypothetical protein